MTNKLPQIYSFACPQAKKEQFTCPQVTNYSDHSKWCLLHREIQPYELNIMDCFNQLIFTNMELFKDRNIHIRVTTEIS